MDFKYQTGINCDQKPAVNNAVPKILRKISYLASFV